MTDDEALIIATIISDAIDRSISIKTTNEFEKINKEIVEIRRQLELVITHINDRVPTIQDTVGNARAIDPTEDENTQGNYLDTPKGNGYSVLHPDGTSIDYPS